MTAHRRRASSHSSTQLVRDWGTTFIETLVAVVLLGTTVVAALAGMAATIRSATVHDNLATAQSRVSDAGDYLTDITVDGDTYVSCATSSTYQPATSAWQVTVESVQFWTGSAWSTCSGGGSTQMQRIGLRSTVGAQSRDLFVVKRKATVAVVAGGTWNDGMVSPNPNPNL